MILNLQKEVDRQKAQETWKYVKGFEGVYKVSSKGYVKSLSRKRKVCGGSYRLVKERILKNSLTNTGYYRVSLINLDTPKSMLVHRLVALAFIPNPENKRTINHKNGITIDNRVENLEWATDKENIDHSKFVLGNKYSDRKLINIETGEVYKSLRYVMHLTRFSKSYLCAMLNGTYPNKSKFKYIE